MLMKLRPGQHKVGICSQTKLAPMDRECATCIEGFQQPYMYHHPPIKRKWQCVK